MLSDVAHASDAPKLSQGLLAGAVAGTVSAVVNNTYSMLYTALVGFSASAWVNGPSVTWASFLPNVLAGLGHWGLQRVVPGARSRWLFGVAVVGVVALSLLAPLRTTLTGVRDFPFLWLTLPMHLAAGGCCLAFVPRIAQKS